MSKRHRSIDRSPRLTHSLSLSSPSSLRSGLVWSSTSFCAASSASPFRPSFHDRPPARCAAKRSPKTRVGVSLCFALFSSFGRLYFCSASLVAPVFFALAHCASGAGSFGAFETRWCLPRVSELTVQRFTKDLFSFVFFFCFFRESSSSQSAAYFVLLSRWSTCGGFTRCPP